MQSGRGKKCCLPPALGPTRCSAHSAPCNDQRPSTKLRRPLRHRHSAPAAHRFVLLRRPPPLPPRAAAGLLPGAPRARAGGHGAGGTGAGRRCRRSCVRGVVGAGWPRPVRVLAVCGARVLHLVPPVPREFWGRGARRRTVHVLLLRQGKRWRARSGACNESPCLLLMPLALGANARAVLSAWRWAQLLAPRRSQGTLHSPCHTSHARWTQNSTSSESWRTPSECFYVPLYSAPSSFCLVHASKLDRAPRARGCVHFAWGVRLGG